MEKDHPHRRKKTIPPTPVFLVPVKKTQVKGRSNAPYRAAVTFFILLTLLFLWSTGTAIAQTVDRIEVGAFSGMKAGGPFPPEWKPLTFDNIPTHTQYGLVSDESTVVIQATSRQSASGLTREISIDPKAYPIIEWRWKVSNVYEKGDVSTQSGDDYPARLYITFEYDDEKVGFFEKIQFEALRLIYGQYPPIGAINYIWAHTSPIGAHLPNSYTDRTHMFVVQSGPTKVNQWVTEKHNVYEDYKRAFGEEPPRISGVAIMTDTDNTKESAVAQYGDIVFTRNPAERPPQSSAIGQEH